MRALAMARSQSAGVQITPINPDFGAVIPAERSESRDPCRLPGTTRRAPTRYFMESPVGPVYMLRGSMAGPEIRLPALPAP